MAAPISIAQYLPLAFVEAAKTIATATKQGRYAILKREFRYCYIHVKVNDFILQ